MATSFLGEWSAKANQIRGCFQGCRIRKGWQGVRGNFFYPAIFLKCNASRKGGADNLFKLFMTKAFYQIWLYNYAKLNNLIIIITYLMYYYYVSRISIFIFLTRRKATEALIHRVSNYPDLLPEMPSITVRL